MGKPSISMGHLYHGYVSHNQRVPIIPPFQTSKDSFLSLLGPEVAQLATERSSKLLQDAGQVRRGTVQGMPGPRDRNRGG